MEKMATKYKVPEKLNLPEIDKVTLEFWDRENIFGQSTEGREDSPSFVFYEGPPSANGMPGIHHVMSRTLKDLFCRYKTMQGFRVMRKGGWDTHGLPVELGVEKKLGITKEDIGKSISIAEYNATCREEVMKYKDVWDDLTRKMGYWVDLNDPYVTFENNYIESLWSLLRKLYDKGYLYKGYTIQPFSPAAGTGLSSHELNLPGAYRDVKDVSAVAQFKVTRDDKSEFLFENTGDTPLYFLAWTTTPWTLPSNTALAVGKKVDYTIVKTYNPYTKEPMCAVLATELYSKYFTPEAEEADFEAFTAEDKLIPVVKIGSCKGSDLEMINYEQLIPLAQPEDGDAFKVLLGDFVTTEDGTGIVHIAPSFGSDDQMVAKKNGIGSLTLVDRQGKFIDGLGELSGKYVKNYKDDPDYESVDVEIVIMLKKQSLCFKSEKYEHSYPHCWRTDKPVIYYPLDSWFIKTADVKDKLIELNNTINWKPESTGSGRFGKWLENLVDWNLSRSRFWGTPLPIWRTEDGEEELCIGSFDELKSEVKKAVEAGFMDEELSKEFDPHRPFVDDIFLVAPSGKKMTREPDLIDVWFDSGAMPYAQWHYPLENEETFKNNFPADFIAEGVDQTRGWFYTLHVIAAMLFDSVAYKNVVSNGLVLDKEGVKMSKRLGNVVDPFETIDKYGADASRWYLMSNSQPWDNLKFDIDGIGEVQRKFFGTLYNTYSFFALYANIDGFAYEEDEIDVAKRPEIDRWIISLLNSLVKDVTEAMDDYEPTKAARSIQNFVDVNLSNWYVRLCRRRFWKGDYSEDKIAAFQTLYRCLDVLSRLSAPIAPFFSDYLYKNLDEVSGKDGHASVHLASYPKVNEAEVDADLEERMYLAQTYSSMVLSLRKKAEIKVRQPLNKILIPVLNEKFQAQVNAIEDLIKSEVNIKEIEYVGEDSGRFVKSIKPDFRVLGKKVGPLMKSVAASINQFGADEIAAIESEGSYRINIEGQDIEITREDVEIFTEDIPGWLVTNNGQHTVALDVTITEELKDEGLARELVNRVQKMRKDNGYEITDRINILVQKEEAVSASIERFKDYICNEILSEDVNQQESVELEGAEELDINGHIVKVFIERKS